MIGTIFTALFAGGGWLAAKAAKFAGNQVIQSFIGAFNKGTDGNVKLAEIDAKTQQVTYTAHADASTERQRMKMNMPVFWMIIIPMFFPPFFTLTMLAFYNVFWWSNGIWPQDWSIAAYPPSVAPWVEKSIDWLYDPLGAPTTTGVATAASFITGKR